LGIESKGRKDFYELRKNWPKTIITWIPILIGFNIVLTCFIGGIFLILKNINGL